MCLILIILDITSLIRLEMSGGFSWWFIGNNW